ncbi:MAG TPA: NAD(P)-dependent oxidoreductase [Alphaproteobacteria bacterium]|nr:NAD(P)-dependent oxidoreductase [Alphaproteobacteria bacterium]
MTKPVRIFLTHGVEMRQNWYGEKALSGLRCIGEVTLNTLNRPLSTQELVEAARGHQIIISDRHTPGEAVLFDNAPDLVAFLRVAVDIRNVDRDAASRNGILVTQASPGFMAAVAEWIMGAMIDCARDTTRYAGEYRAGRQPQWRMGTQLQGSTLGVIGYGAIGRYLCKLGLAFGMRVLVADPYAKVEEPALEQVSLDVLLGGSDFVACLAVATEATENLMNDAAFAKMKPTAWFINASRGNLVDEAALERALDARRIAGAALDVGRAPDQQPSPHIASRADVIATPHVAGLTPQAIEHQALETVRQAAAIAQGRAPAGAVNTDKATRLARLRAG